MCTRKVLFSLRNPGDMGFTPDLSDEEREVVAERVKERDGLFHGWHDTEIRSPRSDNYLIIKVALIEDLETGKVHEIDKENFRFINH